MVVSDPWTESWGTASSLTFQSHGCLVTRWSPDTKSLGRKGGNENTLGQAWAFGKSSLRHPQGRRGWRIRSKWVLVTGGSYPWVTPDCPGTSQALVLSLLCHTLIRGKPRNFTPVRFCLFYHNLNQFPYSCGGHAPSPPGPVGVRGRDPGAQVGWWWSHHSGGPIPRVEGLGLARWDWAFSQTPRETY